MTQRRAVVVGLTLAVALGLGAAVIPAGAHALRDRATSLLRVRTSGRPAIVDGTGREVTLRGVNVNSLGDYYRADPARPPVVPVTGADWDRMAGHGFDVVRLLISWSRVEPEPGRVDRAYLRLVHRTVRDAARRGIRTVVDLHQDAWGKFVATPPGVSCPPGTAPAIGWDGAPRWATVTDGASTCRPGARESSEAVLTAWDSFYSDRHQVMTHLVRAWNAIGREFAHEPAVAAFDLLNEPNHGHRSDYAARLASFYARAIDAIRRGERSRHGLTHIVMFESTVFGVGVAPGFSTDRDLVFAPHNYGESIGDIPLEVEFDYFQSLATGYGAPLWIGEYGWFSDPPAQQPKLARFAAKEDILLTAGDAWWQWRQACGDPHSIGTPGGHPDPVLIHFQRNGCPGDRNLGVVPEWSCSWRPYPRATPGVVTTRRSGCAGPLDLAGTTTRRGVADVWYPGTAHPRVAGADGRVVVRRVPGGWRLSIPVVGTYALHVTT